MKTFEQFVFEDAGEKFRAMSPSQFDDYKRANPGAASKADKLRGTPNKPTTSTNKPTTSTAITKRQPKALPQSRGGSIEKSKGGALAKTPADKGSAMVKQKQAKTQPKPQSTPKTTTQTNQSEKGVPYKKIQKPKQSLNPFGDVNPLKPVRKFAGKVLKPRGPEAGGAFKSKASGDLEGNEQIIRGERK